MNCLRRHTRWQSKRLSWKGVDSSRVREARELPCHAAHSLRFYDGGASSPGCLWPIMLFVSIFGWTQGPFLWCTHLLVKMVSSARVSGRLAGHNIDWHLLPPFGPSRIPPVGLGGSSSVLCSLSGPPVVRQFMQVVITVPGQGGRFWPRVP